MKITTKRIKVITMTHEEHAKFMECMERAKSGHTAHYTAHYAEEKLSDGSFLGVSVVDEHEDESVQPPQKGMTIRPHKY